MESALPSASESDLDEVDNSAICVGVGAKAKKTPQKASTLMKIIVRSQNMLKIMDKIKQEDVSKVNIQPFGSRQWEAF